MPHTKMITRAHPSAIVLLVDQSGSMADFWGGESGQRKSDQVATILNRLLQELTIRCAKGEGIRHYFDVAVIGYGGQVAPALGGNLAGRDLVPIVDIGEYPLRVEERTRKVDDGVGGLIEQKVRFPVWFEARATGGTPMCAALEYARKLLAGWIAQHPDSFPPIVLNITDGESTDGDPRPAAMALTALSTTDGHVTLYNAHISALSSKAVVFPDQPTGLPDVYAEVLFEMSSRLPHVALVNATAKGHQLSDGARGFVFNAQPTELIEFLDIGTSTEIAR